MTLLFTDTNFNDYLSSDTPLMVDFWAEWCGPCRRVVPIIDELADEYAGKINIGKLNVDENDNMVALYGIRTIPTIIFFKGGEMVDKIIGPATKAELKGKLDKMLS